THIVFSKDPCNREEVRHLPEKKDGEQGKCHCINLAPSCGPSHHRRRGSRKGSDDRAKRRACFQWSVDQYIAGQCRQSEHRSQRINEIEQINYSNRGKCDGKGACLVCL